MNCGPRRSSRHLLKDAMLTCNCLATSSSVKSVDIFTSLVHHHLKSQRDFGPHWSFGTAYRKKAVQPFKARECVGQLQPCLSLMSQGLATFYHQGQIGESRPPKAVSRQSARTRRLNNWSLFSFEIPLVKGRSDSF
jgi:hypothetical protein